MKPVPLPFIDWQPEAAGLLQEPMVQQLSALWQVNSLTLGLKALSPNFKVSLLRLGDTEAYAEETALACAPALFCREVILSLEEQPVVWARSVCAKDRPNWLAVLDCGSEPLGQRLFDGRLPITRTAFEYGMVMPTHPMLPPAVAALLPQGGMGARRSAFWWDDAPLLLTECFLPPIKEFL